MARDARPAAAFGDHHRRPGRPLLILYAESSALTKHYVEEPGSDVVDRWIAAADVVSSSRLAYVEVRRGIARSRQPHGADAIRDFGLDWRTVTVIELDDDIARAAADLAIAHDLRSLDAIHLASAVSITAPDLRIATFDERLRRAARRLGLALLQE